jgi:DNA polymerase-3 subunit epsilon
MSALTSFMDMAAKQDYLVLDTETTGLHRGEIVQVAIIDSAGTVLLDRLVRPVFPIPADATRIHGIQNSMVVDEDDWPAVMRHVREIIEGRDLVVYNAVYDRKMFHQSGESAGMDKIEWKKIARWWCAMEAYAEFYGEWNSYHHSYRWQRLTDACRQQEIEVHDAHNALGDCLMTLEVVKRMLTATFGEIPQEIPDFADPDIEEV